MIRQLSILSLLLLWGVSCDSNDGDCGSAGTLPGIDAVIESDIKTDFEVGDRIGIYPVGYFNGSPGILGDVINPLNVEYIYNGRYWGMAQGEDFTVYGNLLDIYAYFPYDEGLSRDPDKTNLYAYPFDLSGDQSEKETDFLWAKSAAVSPDTNNTLLVFSHVFTRFMINLNYNDSDPTDVGLEVHNVFPHVLIDLSDGSVTVQEIRDEIIPMIESTPAPGYDLSYAAIVPPQFIPAGTALFTMDNDGDTSAFYLSGDMDFQPGYTYIFNLIVGSLDATPEAMETARHTITTIP